MKRILLIFTLSLINSPLQASQPNVLFIAIDDLRADLNCYGNPQIHSPNIDRLAEVGTLFNRAYCQQAVCNPSRSSLLTGLRLDTLHLWDLPTHFRERIAEVVTLPQLFKQNGYHTRCVGKIFHNWRQDDYKGDAVSWSAPEELHYNSHGNDKAIVNGKLPPNISNVPKCVIRDVPDEAYFDGRVAGRAIEVLNQIKDKPFFLAVGFWKPHAHFNAPKKYWDLYKPSEIKLPVNRQNPRNVPEIALHNGQEILRAYKNAPNKYPTDHQAREMRRGYYANISYMDAQVGKVLDELDRLKLRDNTVIVLWSDHGFHLGENGLWAKTSNFELDARVPVIISTPNFNQSQKTDSLIELLDIYPTLTDLCQLEGPDNLAGKSLLPILRNPKASVKHQALTQHCRPAYPPNGEDPEAMGYSIRTDRYRYTEWREFHSHAVIAREIYDHKTDPLETNNVVEDTSVRLKQRLAKQLEAVISRQVHPERN
ncbi:MAG: iduronate sulfatase [Planctomycetaceae bacterium]|nr:iduronate sulfatase [Planctomycetaceae bacterium]